MTGSRKENGTQKINCSTLPIKATIILLMGMIINCFGAKAQDINWGRLDSTKNVIRVKVGLDQGMVYGLEYGKILGARKVKWMPFFQASLPFGERVIDDYQLQIGTRAKFFQLSNWALTAHLAIVHRRNENPFVNMFSLGGTSGVQIGYYKRKGFILLNFSTNNSLLTYLRHNEAYKGNYPMVKDGWYSQTANNQLLSIHSGYSRKKIDLTLALGIQRTEEFKSSPGLPIYLKTGLNYRF